MKNGLINEQSKPWYLVIFCAFTAHFLSCRHDPQPALATGKDTLLIYLMAGQSNMAGRGAVEAEDRITYIRILSMDRDSQFITAAEPLNFYQPGLSGLDCGLSFGLTMLPALPGNTNLGLIQCAIGSASVEDWLFDSLRTVNLYTNMLRRATVASRQGRIKGILWHQGERNADDTSAYSYAMYMRQLIANWRRDMGAGIPVFMGKLAAFCKRPYTAEVNAAIDEIGRTEANVYIIETADLTCNPDSIHFDAKSQRIIGQRFAMAALASR